MGRIGTDLLNQTKDDYKGGKSSSRKDILSLLVRANDLPEAQRLKDEQVMGRAYKPNFNCSIFSIYLQRSLLSLSLATKQQGTHARPLDILKNKIHTFSSLT